MPAIAVELASSSSAAGLGTPCGDESAQGSCRPKPRELVSSWLAQPGEVALRQTVL